MKELKTVSEPKGKASVISGFINLMPSDCPHVVFETISNAKLALIYLHYDDAIVKCDW